MRKSYFAVLILGAILCVIGLGYFLRYSNPSRPFPAIDTVPARSEYSTMGTFLSFTVHPGGPEAGDAIATAYREIERLNAEYSTYIDSSLASRVNQAAPESVEVTDEFRMLLDRSREMHTWTGGRFDITVGPLMKLWGFQRRQGRVPADSEIRETLQRVGFDRVKIDGNSVALSKKGMALDFGAVVKGYAVDRAADILKERGFKNFLVNLGGNMHAAGLNPEGKPWHIGIRDPRNEEKMIGTLLLSDRSVATSGDYERMFMHNGKRYAHIIDPKTGYPIEEMAAVTVVTRDALTADLFSTSCFLAGPALLPPDTLVEGVIYGVCTSTDTSTISWSMTQGLRKFLIDFEGNPLVIDKQGAEENSDHGRPQILAKHPRDI